MSHDKSRIRMPVGAADDGAWDGEYILQFDIQALINAFLHWINEGHEAIMWLSGVTGISSTVLLVMIVCFGRNIADFVLKLLRFVLFVAIIMFLLCWYVNYPHLGRVGLWGNYGRLW